MARPQKNNADYFSHDKDMRNDEKIKAVRKKFGHEWYSCWCMFLEKLCDADNFKLEYNELNLELWGGDFDIEAEKLKLIIDYFIKIKLVFIEENYLYSQKLIDRFEWMLEKRSREKEKVKNIIRWENWKFQSKKPWLTVKNNNFTVSHGQSATEMPQSKVKYSKVNISKDIIKKDIEKRFFEILSEYEKIWNLDIKEILEIKEITNWILEWDELLKFYNYRAEKTKTGEMRWELEKTFEIKRRLIKWKSWIKEKIESKQKPNKNQNYVIVWNDF